MRGTYTAKSPADVAQMAANLWHEFEQRAARQWDPQSLYGSLFWTKSKTPVNPCALSFFIHCSSKVRNISSPVIHSSEEFGDFNPAGWDGRPASWLWNMGYGVPGIVYNRAMVSDKLQNEREERRVITRLILHETGHMVLHWDHLRSLVSSSQMRNPTGMPQASYVQEREAWWFCSIVIGLALGWVAHKTREGPPLANDQAWLHA